MTTSTRPAALITGASSGIGASYADRLARRGYDLVLVARDRDRMEAIATPLRAETGATIDVLRADLTKPADLHAVEARLRDDASVILLVNNAGAGDFGGFTNPDLDAAEKLIALNVTAVMRLAGAIIPRLLASGGGSIINVASVLAFGPEVLPGVYSSTKAFVLTFSQSLQVELGPRGIYVQALLPAATRTEIWERGGRSIDSVANAMDVDEMVDAALVAFDRKELITLPSLPDEEQWNTFNAARLAILPNLRQKHAAERYRSGLR